MATADQDKEGRVWTGGYKNSVDTWVWADGAQWSFTDWDQGNPNNLKGDQDHLEIFTYNYNKDVTKKGKWNDHRESHKIPYICQINI